MGVLDYIKKNCSVGAADSCPDFPSKCPMCGAYATNRPDAAGYKSPIEAIYSATRVSFEDGVMKAVADAGIQVDRKELIRALQYDREQYIQGFNIGYAQGKADALKELFGDGTEKID